MLRIILSFKTRDDIDRFVLFGFTLIIVLAFQRFEIVVLNDFEEVERPKRRKLTHVDVLPVLLIQLTRPC